MSLPASNSSINSSTGNDALPDLPIKILESLVPGYSAASRFLLQYFSIDISFYVSILAFLYAFNKARRFFASKFYEGFRQYCTSNVHIDGDDDLYDLVIKWIAEMRPDISSRWVLAKTQYGSAVTDVDKQEDGKAFLDAALDENGNFNFSRASARIPPRYEPYHGAYYFWHTWTDVFLVSRTERRKSSDDGRYERLIEEIDIRCVGRTTAATKRLLAEIKLWSVNNQISKTAIRSPSSPDHGWYRRPWTKTSERPCRPMSTVILEEEQKALIKDDINEFLHPLSTKWYATRGIPYRRGYLFHGPPGTGKTSLSFALAGLFGLDIYIIPLMDPELSEAYLSRLFNALPRRCIVLLEDIDTAGVQSRDEDGTDDEDSDSDSASKKKGANQKSDSPPRNRRGFRNRHRSERSNSLSTERVSNISLSGLLNVIDGVATHEGRILIMTTNHPEKLDAALIRAGRVDLQIKFSCATKSQIRNLFLRMYQVDVDSASESSLATLPPEKKHAGTGGVHHFSTTELDDLAIRFAEEVPEETFAPSDIQGFLLLHKKDPRIAVAEVGAWREKRLAEMEEKAEKDKAKREKMRN
ncbi:P-loop containing nucleoside triphosphate hydrolase protein [Delphinella strobiligena]|nr:P-loop containing nucleoside triphosphate hydrolase protein [Delphinella strobiligena]